MVQLFKATQINNVADLWGLLEIEGFSVNPHLCLLQHLPVDVYHIVVADLLVVSQQGWQRGYSVEDFEVLGASHLVFDLL